jgi:hypothetical protein
MVHGTALGNSRASDRLFGAKALAKALAKADLLKLLTQEMQISCVFGLKYHRYFLSRTKCWDD